MTEYFRINPSLTDNGWVPFGNWDSSSFAISGLGINISPESANATWGPFLAFAEGLANEGVQIQLVSTTSFNSWFEWYKGALPVDPVGSNVEAWSRLFARDFVESNYERLAETFVDRNISMTWL
jgi:hypothetical protein